MFSKLAFKNVGRSMKDYGVWFLTIAFGVCLFYVFNSLETQAVFQYLGSGPQAPTAQAIRELIGMLSVFVWVVLAFLILYASGFLINSTLFRIFSETKSSWNKDIYFPVTCNNVAFKNKGGDKMHLSPSCYLLSLILFYRKLLFLTQLSYFLCPNKKAWL